MRIEVRSTVGSRRVRPYMVKDKLKRLLKTFGPGFVTGASDDDPSGIATYSQTGAMFGYTQLWTALFSFPFMAVIQEMCGRIGMVTGKGLAGVVKSHYSKKLLYFAVVLLLVANTINIGADLGAMVAAAQLLIDVPFVILLILITAGTLALQILVPYKVYAKFLKYLTLSLFAYFIVVFVVKQDWGALILATFVPHISLTKEYLVNIVAILGTTISPYLFFWQASEEVEEEVDAGKIANMGQGKPRFSPFDLKTMRKDTVSGMLFSNLVMFFVIATTASTLHTNGIVNIVSAAQAAEALRPLVGDLAFVLFAAGIIGTGLLAVPVLSGSAAYAIAETLGWKEGLYRKVSQAHGFYGVIAIATLVGLVLNFIPIPPFTLLYYAAVLNGIAAPPLLVILLLVANNKKIMGKNTNTRASNVLGVIITTVMFIAAIGLFIL